MTETAIRPLTETETQNLRPIYERHGGSVPRHMNEVVRRLSRKPPNTTARRTAELAIFLALCDERNCGGWKTTRECIADASAFIGIATRMATTCRNDAAVAGGYHDANQIAQYYCLRVREPEQPRAVGTFSLWCGSGEFRVKPEKDLARPKK